MVSRARFTPSLLPKETLERLFVGREDLLDTVVDRVREASQTGRLAHTLLLGARGSGKTHLISLVYHRAKDLPGFGQALTLSWLPEDPWAVTRFDDLLDGIGQKEEPKPTDAMIRVVLVENLDQIFGRLGPAGQRQLRAWLEREENVLLVATATRATSSLVEQAAPFYGFFNMEELAPFAVDDAVAMLQRIARLDGDTALEARLGSAGSRARLASIGQLTGGAPRIWAVLSTGLTAGGLDDLFETLMMSLDDLTPYYQERLARLSGHELRAVVGLIQASGAVTVRDLAVATGVDQRSLGTTLRRLEPAWVRRRQGWLVQRADRRKTYYELAEPLARVALEIKANRGEPLRTVVDFLTAWYSRDELAQASGQRIDFGQDDAAAAVGVGSAGQVDAISTGGTVGAIGAADGDAAAVPPWLTAMPQRTLRLAADESNSPARVVLDGLMTGLSTDEPARPWPDGTDLPGLIGQCDEIDQALAVFDRTGKADAILALPGAVVGVLESRLEQASSSLLRLELALMAVQAGGDESWLDRALLAAASVRDSEARLAQVLLGCVRICLGQDAAGLATLEHSGVSGQLTTQELAAIVSSVMHLPPPVALVVVGRAIERDPG